MKKSTFLTFATVGAIAATSAGTYAVWDTTTDKSTGTLTVDTPIVLDAPATSVSYTSTETRTLGTARTYSGDVTFNVTGNTDNVAKTIELTPKVIANDNTDVTDQFDITVKEGADTATSLIGGKYTDATISGTNAYTVNLKPKDSITAENVDKLTAGQLTVEVAGELK